jgi:hypothetical protein
MKYLKILFAFIILLTLSCDKDTESGSIKAIGVVKASGASTFQYGTHILTDNSGNMLYALRSKSVNLDNHIDKNVEIKGHKVKGYPVDGGPEYLEVTKVK